MTYATKIGVCTKGHGNLEEGLEQERKSVEGCGYCAFNSAGTPSAPRRERARGWCLQSRPTYQLHCLFWPPSWSTEKAGEAGLGEQLEQGLLSGTWFRGTSVRYLVGGGPAGWLLPTSRLGGYKKGGKLDSAA